MIFTSQRVHPPGICFCGADVADHGVTDNHSPVETGPRVNPVLEEFREEWAYRLNWRALLAEWIEGIPFEGYLECAPTAEQREHALKVLKVLNKMAGV